MVSIWTREGFNYKLRLRRKCVLFVDNVGRDEVDFLGESVDYENILTFFTTSTFCFSWFASSFIFTARCSWTSFARNLKIINFCKFLIVLFDIKRRGEKKFCLFQRFFFEKTSSFSYLETILCEFFPTYSSFYHWKLTLE